MAQPQIVEVPGIGPVEFPADMNDADIASAIKKNLMVGTAPQPQQQPQSRGFLFNTSTPEQQAVYQKTVKENGWGTGIPKLAYDLGGRVTDATGSPLAGYAANVATQAIPSLLSSFSLEGPASSLARGPAEWLMGSALKPSANQWKNGKAARAIDTMLQEGGFNPTKGGVDLMRSRIADLNDEISTALANSNATVDKKVVAGYLQDAINKFERQVTPGADIKAIQAAWNEFLAHPLLSGDKIPVQLAQQMKQGTYKVLGEKAYGEQMGASAEAQKTIARGLKEEISKAVPEVVGLNKREGDIINAMKLAEHRAAIEANKNPLGLGAVISQPWMIPYWLWDRSSGAKAATARALFQAGEPSNIAPLGVLATEAANQPPSNTPLWDLLRGGRGALFR